MDMDFGTRASLWLDGMLQQVPAEVFDTFAFAGNFHPIIVHFPLALLPLALGLAALARLRGSEVLWLQARTSAVLAFASALLAISLGFAKAWAESYSWSDIGAHASFALLATGLLAFALLPSAGLRFSGEALLAIFALLTRLIAKLLLYLLLILLSPLLLLLWLLAWLYRLTLGRFMGGLHRLLFALRAALGRAWKACKNSVYRLYLVRPKLHSVGRWRAVFAAGAMLALVVTGLEGGNRVHGEGHLLKNAPAWMQPYLAEAEDQDSAWLDEAYYQAEVVPVLRKHCFKCHGEDKAKGNLRLHSAEAIRSANILVLDDPWGSELLRRVLLPPSHSAAMPPREHGVALAEEDIATLIAWIRGASLDEDGGVAGSSAGASASKSLPPELARLNSSLRPISAEQLAAFNKPSLRLQRLHAESQLLRANFQFVEAEHLAAELERIKPLWPHILELDISGQALPLSAFSVLPNLQRLNAASAGVDDGQVPAILAWSSLHWLNVFDNPLSDEAIAAIEADLPALETLHAPAKETLRLALNTEQASEKIATQITTQSGDKSSEKSTQTSENAVQ